MAFEAASRLPKSRGAALVGLAEVEFQLSQFRAAEKYAKEAVARGGGLRAKLVLGNIYFKLQDYKRATLLYKKVLILDHQQKEARRNLEAAQRLLNR